MDIKSVLSAITAVLSVGALVVSTITAFIRGRQNPQTPQPAYGYYSNANNNYQYGYGYGYQQPQQPTAPVTPVTPQQAQVAYQTPVQTAVPTQTVVTPAYVSAPIVNPYVIPSMNPIAPMNMNVIPNIPMNTMNMNNIVVPVAEDTLKWKDSSSDTTYSSTNMNTVPPMYSYGYGYADISMSRNYPVYDNNGYAYNPNYYNNQPYGYGWTGYNNYNTNPNVINYKYQQKPINMAPMMNSNYYSAGNNISSMNLGSNNMGSYSYNPSSNVVYRWTGTNNTSNGQNNQNVSQQTNPQQSSDEVVPLFGTPDWFVQKK